MSPRDPNFRVMFPNLLKKCASYLEVLYGLSTSGEYAGLPPPPENSSIARHFAAYLALSGVTAWLYDVTDQTTGEPVTLLITKPRKNDTLKGFKAIAMRPWMKDVPDLVNLYLRAMRNKDSYFGTMKLNPNPWFRQLEEGVSSFKAAVDLAGEIASREDITLPPQPNPMQPEPDIAPFDLLAVYRQNPSA